MKSEDGLGNVQKNFMFERGLYRMKKISETRKGYIATIRCDILKELFQLAKQKDYKTLPRYQYLEEKRQAYDAVYIKKVYKTPEKCQQYSNLKEAMLKDDGKTQEGNLTVRRATKEDFPLLLEYEKKKSERRYPEEVLEACAKDYYTNTASLYYVIFYGSDHRMIGYCGINNFYRKEIDIAVDILEGYRGNGYGYQALKKYFQMLHKYTNDEMKEVYINIEPDNIRSQKLFTKLGARFERLDFYDLPQEEAEEYEKSHLYLIDQDLESLAAKLCVEPRSLLSRVLVYKMNL